MITHPCPNIDVLVEVYVMDELLYLVGMQTIMTYNSSYSNTGNHYHELFAMIAIKVTILCFCKRTVPAWCNIYLGLFLYVLYIASLCNLLSSYFICTILSTYGRSQTLRRRGLFGVIFEMHSFFWKYPLCPVINHHERPLINAHWVSGLKYFSSSPY